MTSIRSEALISAPAAKAWALLREVAKAHELFSPVLTASSMEGDLRTVTFANGMVVQERIIAVDDDQRRICYAVQGDMFEHHSAAMEILPVDDRHCRFVWISDVLPDDRAEMIRPLIENGTRALVANIERS